MAFLAVAAFAVFPLTIRYGRAFQPDAAMMGAVVLGLACWDRHRSSPRWYWLAAAWFLVALGFALKITAAFLLLPLVARHRACPIAASDTHGLLDASAGPVVVCVGRPPARRREKARVPRPITGRSGSGCSGPSALLKRETLKFVGWFLLVRAFTPLGCGPGALRASLVDARRQRSIATRSGWSGESRHWLPWRFSPRNCITSITGSCSLPSPRWGSAAAWHGWRRAHRGVAVAAGCDRSSCSRGFRSARRGGRPPNGTDWNRRPAPSRRRSRPTPGWSRRRPCCFRPIAAAAAWSGATRPRRERPESGRRARQVDGPLELVEYYRRQGARYFADLGCREADLTRKGLHDAVRRRYKVIVDRPDVIIADLADSEMHWNAN